MASSHGMKMSLEDDFLFNRPSTSGGYKTKQMATKRPHTSGASGNAPWVNPNAIPAGRQKKYHITLDHKPLESRVSKKAPYAPRTKMGTTIWDQPKVVNGKVFSMPEYSALEDPHLRTYFERKLGTKPTLTSASAKKKKPPQTKGSRVVYNITVITGDQKNAGTDANVFISIRGTSSKLQRTQLVKKVEEGNVNASGNVIFKRASHESFSIRCPDLGQLIALEIEHDGVERNQSWYLEEVIVKNQKTKEQWMFKNQCWLSLYEGDCQVKRTLKPSSEEKKPERVIYQVEVVTGDARGAGTDAHVFITMFGDRANTRRVQLINRNVNTFERGQTDVFKIKVKYLGKIQRIMIDHDNTGFAPGWFLDRVTVTNLDKPKEKMYFVCDKWLAKDEGDGEISRLLLGTKSLENVAVAHKYNISTITGDVRGAGTDADVFITLFSKAGNSAEMKLNDSKNNFERKKVDTFNVECPNIGELTRVRIRHNNKGAAAGWFLDKIQVKDGENRSFEFPCGRWLSVTEDDGQISRDLVLAGSDGDGVAGIPYKIEVTTGDVRGAGTNAKVYIILYGGEEGNFNSGKLWIHNGEKNNFDRGKTDIFQVECGEELSPFHHVTVGHDNSGVGPGWFCEMVVVDAPTTGIVQTYFCRDWLADDEGDGTIERDLVEDIDYRKQREIKNVWTTTVHTSDILSAGTDSNVYFVLYGDQGKSDVIHLQNKTDNFERGSVDRFSVDVQDVGVPYKMIIGHDNSNLYSDWHLDKVFLENSGRDRYSFSCGRWIGPDEDDGQCVRELPAEGGKNDPLPVLAYKVCVYTGDKRGAGTDSNVFINIFGQRGDTHERPLIKSNNINKFERNKMDEFVVEAVALDDLTSIRIGHDGKGASDGWFLDKVVIIEPVEQKQYQFICNRWLASDEDDGLIVREIPVGDTATLLKTTSYHLNVKTGDVRGAGTDANVYVKLIGEVGDTGVLQLRQSQNIKNKWERGRTDQFTIEAMDIGKVSRLIIGHDGKGVGAGWFLDSVVVDVPSHGQNIRFACNRWLAEDEEDGLIERELYPSEELETSKKVPYEVEVHTGDIRGAGTNSAVFIVLYGEEKKSEVKWLRTKSDDFERAQVDKFKIETEEIGVLSKLRVGHDNSGFNSAWYCEKIVVRRLKPPKKDEAEGEKPKTKSKKSLDEAVTEDDDCNYLFMCQRWLAKDEDDGQIVRELIPVNESGTARKNSLAANSYIVRVFTGDVRGAGTNSNVLLTIYGEKGDTGERELKKSETSMNKFERNNEDVFTIDAITLGEINKVKIRHDNSGISPSWFLDRVEVEDKGNQGKVYVFPCERWLSKTEDDGALSRELVAVDRGDLERRRTRKMSRVSLNGKEVVAGGDDVDLEQKAETTTYNIEVVTGDVKGGGTDSNVFLMLFGEHGDSGHIDLKTSKTNSNKFERNNTDVFTAEAVDLGDLQKIRIGHDNKGGFSGWYLDKVVVDAPSLGRKWTFPAGRWLDKSKDDGQVEVDLLPMPDRVEVYDKHVPYEIVVYTSDISSAGSDASVYVQLYGVDGACTDQVFLTETKKKRKECFNRGSVDVFVREMTDVGDQIEKLRIGHDNKGILAAWHLDKVEVRRLTEGDGRGSSASTTSGGSITYVFPCGRWLAKDEDDGAIVRELVPAKVTEEVLGEDGALSVSEHEVTDALAVHVYKVHVFTADKRRAGTDANVFINLIGENGDSGERPLAVSETHRDKFERGQEDVFSLEVVDLGTIHKVEIRHDDSNPNSDWLLDRIEVVDETKTESQSIHIVKYFFSCERWLSKTKENCKLKRTLYEKNYEGDRGSMKSSVFGSQMMSDTESICSAVSIKGTSSTPPPLSRSASAEKVYEEQVKGKMRRSSTITSLKLIPYTIRVATGDKDEHSTEANAFVTLIGTDGVSDKLPLTLIGKSKFEATSIETFSLETLDYGDIKKIELGHDGYLPKDSWYVCSVEVDLPTTGHKYFFPCECWLGKDKEDGKTYRIFSVDDAKDVAYKPKVPYEVMVYTGDVKEAGTDAEIKFVLFGDEGQSQEITLDKEDERFERSSVDMIRLDIDDVGNPTKIRVETDGKGTRPHWFLCKMTFLNLNTDGVTTFKCNHWLSKTKEDGKLLRELSGEVGGETILEETEYTISVKTGDKRGCGTDANVFLLLFGQNGSSGELALKESKNYSDKFERGQTDVFAFKMLSLGPLTKVRVWHDNKYMRSGWFLESIEVVDNQEQKTYLFPCQRWLAKNEDDGSLMRELVCTTDDKDDKQQSGYEVSISTSDKAGASTLHNITIVLVDESGSKSPPLLIENSSHDKLLSRGETHTTTLQSNVALGKLKSLLVAMVRRKGVKGEDDALKWHLERITVKDLQNDQSYVFTCDDWLSLKSSKESSKMLEISEVKKSKVSTIRELKPVQYELKVYTADVAHAGTDANVSCTLFGENGDSGKRELKKKFRDLFERGQMDDFKIEVLDLGELTKLYIEHDNHGIGAGWMLDRVDVTNTTTGHMTSFPCQQWLDKKKGDKQTWRELYPVAK